MSKILTEPRVIKEIKGKAKRKKLVKRTNKMSHTVLAESEDGKENVSKLVEQYKKDPYIARIIYMQADRNKYKFNRMVFFKDTEGSFDLASFNTGVGISINNRMYNTQTKIASWVYKDGKFWYLDRLKGGNRVTHMNYLSLGIICYSEPSQYLKQYLRDNFFWFKMIEEEPLFHSITFNTIISKKLFTHKALYRHLFGVTPKVGRLLGETTIFYHDNSYGYGHRGSFDYGKFKEIKEVLGRVDNIDYLTGDLAHQDIFYDTCLMSKTLNKRLNGKWTPKRLKLEHDRWSMEITNALLSAEPLRELKLRPIYQQFAEFSGYDLLTTNRDMLYEGLRQHHCVGTYIHNVEKRGQAIFSVDGYTLQVGVKNYYELYNMQLKGRYNQNPTTEFKEFINSKLDEFNKKVKLGEIVLVEAGLDDEGVSEAMVYDLPDLGGDMLF